MGGSGSPQQKRDSQHQPSQSTTFTTSTIKTTVTAEPSTVVVTGGPVPATSDTASSASGPAAQSSTAAGSAPSSVAQSSTVAGSVSASAAQSSTPAGSPSSSVAQSSTAAGSASSSAAQSSATGTSSTAGVAYHRFHRAQQQLFTQTNGQAEWGDWIYATGQVNGLTYANGASDSATRSAFVNNGSLADVQNTTYRAINAEYPVFAFAIDYGNVSSTPQSSLFAIVLAQEEAIQFRSGQGVVQNLSPLWTSQFSDGLALVRSYLPEVFSKSC